MKAYILIVLSCITSVSLSFAQDEWVVPQDQKQKLSPNKFSETMIKSGESIFSKNCIICHGTPGQGNYNAALKPSPGDASDEKFQKNTDGELFYKIKDGRAVMPSFKNALSNQEIWSVVAYVRSFNSTYSQEVATKTVTNIPEGASLSLAIKVTEKDAPIIVSLTGDVDGKAIPIEGVGIKLMVKRYFGSLQLGSVKTTNKDGLASFKWNNEIPGDSIGNVTLTAQLDDPDTYGNITIKHICAIAEATNKPPLNEERAMWNTFKKAPYWILFGYFGAVIAVWFCIFYVVTFLKKIYKAGSETISDDERLI